MIQTSFFAYPEEDKPEEIIPIHPAGFKPRKLEEVLPDRYDIEADMYLIYPNGGYHPFYGVPNTLPRYQEKIWPFIKRIKFNEKYKGDEKIIERVRRGVLRENTTTSQVNPYLKEGYFSVNLTTKSGYLKNDYTRKTKSGHVKHMAPNQKMLLLHRAVGYAWLPNPHNKPLVMHINDDRSNFLPENLKWGTKRENAKGTIQRRPDTMEQKYLNCVMKGYIKG